MDNHHLRGIILKLQDRLTDNDRKRLHFFLANDVPRRIRDDESLSGTLNLMESLFDQHKINEQDFTFLINAFKQIQCADAEKLLREHKKRLQSSWLKQPNLTSVIPPLNYEIVEDQEEDKSASQCLLNQKNNYGNNNKIFDSNNTNINPVTINVDNKKIVSTLCEENKPFYVSFKMNKYLFSIILFIMMIMAILIGFFIIKIYKMNKPEWEPNNEGSLGEQNNKTELMNNLTLENAQLKKQIKQLQIDYENCLVKPGKVFGNSDAPEFDDSAEFNYTYSYYLNKFTIREHRTNGLESYQFEYYSPSSKQENVRSAYHGDEDFRYKSPSPFDKNDKIKRVKGRLVSQTVYNEGRNLTKTYITGLEFTTTNDITSYRYKQVLGEVFEEEYPGYILGYVIGKSREYVEQIQFVWYRDKKIESGK